MKLTYETINLLMLLMPGLLSSSLFNLIRRKVGVSTFDKIVEAFIFTFLIYVALNLTYGWEPIAQTIKVDDEIKYVFTGDKCLVFLTLVYSLIFPVVWGTIVHHDLHMRLFRFLKFTDRTSRDTAWDDVFIDEKRYLTVHLNDERRITGWPLYYSNNKDEGFMYLTNAAWLDESNEYIATESHGILIARDKVDLVEFMNDDEVNDEENSNGKKQQK